MTSRILFLLLCFFVPQISFSHTVPIAQFNLEPLDKWDQKSFVGHTQYQIVQENNQNVLKATANQSASGIAKEITVDLLKTPFINWSWKIDDRLTGLNELTKGGDDYVARIYLVKKGGFFIWNTKALNYVWSSNQQIGAQWDNAYAGDNARMLAVRTASDPQGVWLSEKRNVFEDMIRLFGDQGSQKANEEAYQFIDVIAIMTDTDDSKRKATAYYGDIYFSEN